MISIHPQHTEQKQLYQYLISTVVPRPIALVSTIDAHGSVNLAPFSYFNLFSVQPPILIFSPTLAGKDAGVKNTLENVQSVPHAVVNMVTYGMVQQMSLTSAEFAKGVNEFEKTGFTPQASEVVLPPRVQESPIQFECIVNETISLGKKGGAGNLIIAEIQRIHLSETLLNPQTHAIDQTKLDVVARMGGNYYCRAVGEALFEVQRPANAHLLVTYDQLPPQIKNNTLLTANHIGQLMNVEKIPPPANSIDNELFIKNSLDATLTPAQQEQRIYQYAAQFLNQNEVQQAWQILQLIPEIANFLQHRHQNK